MTIENVAVALKKKHGSAAKAAKALGFKTLQDACSSINVTPVTMYNYFNTNPVRFYAELLGLKELEKLSNIIK